MSEESKYSPETLRKLSHTVLHASERGRRSLFEKLTKGNIAEIERMSQEKPIFYENDESAERKILLDDEIAGAFPPEFFENPTEWIESQDVIRRGDNHLLPEGFTISGLWKESYDVTKVKSFLLKCPDGREITVVSKRLNRSGTEEVSLAKEAYDAGIPTPKVLGEICDKGNVYALFEYIEGINLNAAPFLLYPGYGHENPNSMGVIFDFKLVFYHSHTLETFRDDIQEFFKKNSMRVSPELQNKLEILRKDSEEANLCLELLFDLKGVIQFREEDRLPRIRAYKKIVNNPFVESLALALLQELGFSSFDEYLQKIQGMQWNSSEFVEMEDRFEEQLTRHRNKKLFYETKAAGIFQKYFYGFDPVEEKEKILRQCQVAGIEHKDFEDRNFVIPWNFEHNRPSERKPGEPNLYIIDWELDPKKQKNKK